MHRKRPWCWREVFVSDMPGTGGQAGNWSRGPGELAVPTDPAAPEPPTDGAVGKPCGPWPPHLNPVATKGDFALSKGCLSMAGDIFGCHNHGTVLAFSG